MRLLALAIAAWVQLALHSPVAEGRHFSLSNPRQLAGVAALPAALERGRGGGRGRGGVSIVRAGGHQHQHHASSSSTGLHQVLESDRASPTAPAAPAVPAAPAAPSPASDAYRREVSLGVLMLFFYGTIGSLFPYLPVYYRHLGLGGLHPRYLLFALCCAMLCYAVPCYAMLCYAML
jgi:hypothetical protein